MKPATVVGDLKECTKCKEFLSFSSFSKRVEGYLGLNSFCKNCVNERQIKYLENEENVKRNNVTTKKRRQQDKSKVLWHAAKGRAKKSMLPFNISVEDIVIPEFCPLLGIRIDHKATVARRGFSPSLDKKIPELGYVKGNVWVISQKANAMKWTSSFEEFATMYHNWKKILGA